MHKAILPVMALIAAVTASVASCSSARAHGAADSGDSRQAPESVQAAVPAVRGGSPDVGIIPRAVVYKTNGDYADRVPVTLNASGTALVSYPAPADLTDTSTPLSLADGYLLDRRGVNLNTAFLDMTYSRYRALSHSPAPAELMGMIIPGGQVTALVRLPMTTQQAVADTAECNRLIRSGFEGCDVVRLPLTIAPAPR